MARLWTQDEKRSAIAMREAGASSSDIGARIGRSASAVRTMLSDSGISPKRETWAKRFQSDPIGQCPEDERRFRDAISGSAKLRAAILGTINKPLDVRQHESMGSR